MACRLRVFASRWILLFFAASLSNQEVAGEGPCAIAFTGPNCEFPANLPCFGKAYTKGITVWQKDLGDNLRAYQNVSRLMKIMKIGKHPASSEEEALQRFPPEPLWGLRKNTRSNPYRSCAVVGNSRSLKSSEGPFFGADIDRHDFIMRFNNAPTKGYEKYVGSRTDLRWENQRFNGFRADSDDSLLAWYCHPTLKLDKPKHSFHYDCRDPMSDWPATLTGMLKKKVHPLNPDFDEWLANAFRGTRSTPSSGMQGVAILAHVCKEVHIYGMGGTSKLAVWYWDKYPGFKNKPTGTVLEKKFPRYADREFTVHKWSFIGNKPASTERDLPQPVTFGRRRRRLTAMDIKVEDKCYADLETTGQVFRHVMPKN
mmetsp:Transcript_14186/g.30347  ORF Transcript_14186/g.30347 Transcript_14186/m.30347 type:complete len:370 (-) Transcript_14186:287-1396(-)|eukprot:CAMPEP_0118941762 /NCGR_PEP_ID=MMETSP1169-20130426/34584_1 /TAXON_ID=36882 /ORGANISM="Pyramimonas obovata, Strain CCMP722" /LENGTH=369 /DNA_ID=CAMNT_0006886603 /DNA_START=230 /DNA_END=1339 /DNA_ORIENTATION=-